MAKRKWSQKEIKEYRKTNGPFFYCNKEDSNFLVHKEYGYGKTFNWANPKAWIATILIIGMIILTIFY